MVHGELPRGCELCQRGLKSIVFVTGLCPRACFYCPLGPDRKNKDVVYVNEVPVGDIVGIVAEVARSASLGASVTGGDPLVRFERTKRVIEELKSVFGEGFHIHLYTTGRGLSPGLLKELERLGLDELRIHPEERDVRRILDVVAASGISTGFEIPMFPNEAERVLELARVLEEAGVDFLNLNELEFAEPNALSLLGRGYILGDDYISARGSREAALEVVRRASEEGLDVSVHFCPVIVKDRYQTGLRLFRRSQLVARPYEKVTDEGTLLKLQARGRLDSIGLPRALWRTTEKGLAETSIDLAHTLVSSRDFGEVYLVEQLGDFRRMLLERTPLKKSREAGL